jgi:hypothetical protein
MQIYLTYHNPINMRHELSDSPVQYILTNKDQHPACGDVVWIVTFVTSGAKRTYGLGGVFRVDEVLRTKEMGFKWQVAGKGKRFRPLISIEVWHPVIKRVTGNFAFGTQVIKDRALLDGLIECVVAAGGDLGGCIPGL